MSATTREKSSTVIEAVCIYLFNSITCFFFFPRLIDPRTLKPKTRYSFLVAKKERKQPPDSSFFLLSSFRRPTLWSIWEKKKKNATKFNWLQIINEKNNRSTFSFFFNRSLNRHEKKIYLSRYNKYKKKKRFCIFDICRIFFFFFIS